MTMHVKGVGIKFPDGTEQTTAAVGGSGGGTGGSGVYTKAETDAKLATKANVGVSYTKAEADNLVSGKADMGVSYTKTETETRLATKADKTDVYTKSEIDSQHTEILAGTFVKGMIMMWWGDQASVPTGWIVCAGSAGSPDLRSKFVIGAGAFNPNDTGGYKDAVNVSHTHTASAVASGTHEHGQSGQTLGPGSGGYSFNSGSGANNVLNTQPSGSHTHTVNVTASGESGTNKNLPPFHALFYIMKL
jgi:hypothetical protein